MSLKVSGMKQFETETPVLHSISYLRCLLYSVSSLSFTQDIQGEVPSHLLRLKVEVEQSRVAVIIQDCRAELDREMRALSGTCTSERVIKEHRVSLRFGRNLKQIKPRVRVKER